MPPPPGAFSAAFPRCSSRGAGRARATGGRRTRLLGARGISEDEAPARVQREALALGGGRARGQRHRGQTEEEQDR